MRHGAWIDALGWGWLEQGWPTLLERVLASQPHASFEPQFNSAAPHPSLLRSKRFERFADEAAVPPPAHGSPAVPVAAGVAPLPGQLSIQLSSGRSLSLNSKDLDTDSVGEMRSRGQILVCCCPGLHGRIAALRNPVLLTVTGLSCRLNAAPPPPPNPLQPATTLATTQP